MEGDVIVMQDVFVFEQTGVVEGKIQGRLKATGIRPKFVEKFEVMGSTCRPASSASPTRAGKRRGPRGSHDLAVAGAAALAILVLAIGVAMSGRLGHLRPARALCRDGEAEGRREGSSDRPGRRRRPARPEPGADGHSTRRSSSATSARTSRATSRGRTSICKPTEFLVIWAGSIIGVPLIMVFLSVVPAGAAQSRSCC